MTDLEKLKEWVKQLLPDNYDKIDIEAHYDSSLNLSENKRAIRKMISPMIKDLKHEAKVAECEAEKEKYYELKQAEEEVIEHNNKIVYEENTQVDSYYTPIYRIIDKMSQEYIHLAFVKGRPGTGKSFSIRKRLLHNGLKDEDYLTVCGEVTEAYLYRLIYENNGKIIHFKDVVKLLNSLGSVNLLKAACESDGVRVLSKSNYSKVQDDLPDRFVCKCRFIFDYNNINNRSLREDFEALISRGDFIELNLSNSDMQNIMLNICKEDWQVIVTKYLIEKFNSCGLFRLNLRSQWKAFQTYQWAVQNGLNWQEEIMQEVKNTSRTRNLLYSLIGNTAIRTMDLKKLLLKHEFVNTISMADRRITEWLFTDELYKWSEEEKNFFVSIEPRQVKT